MDSSRFAPPADAEATWNGRIPDAMAPDVPVLSSSQAGLQALAELAEPSAHRVGLDLLDLSA